MSKIFSMIVFFTALLWFSIAQAILVVDNLDELNLDNNQKEKVYDILNGSIIPDLKNIENKLKEMNLEKLRYKFVPNFAYQVAVTAEILSKHETYNDSSGKSITDSWKKTDNFFEGNKAEKEHEEAYLKGKVSSRDLYFSMANKFEGLDGSDPENVSSFILKEATVVSKISSIPEKNIALVNAKKIIDELNDPKYKRTVDRLLEKEINNFREGKTSYYRHTSGIPFNTEDRIIDMPLNIRGSAIDREFLDKTSFMKKEELKKLYEKIMEEGRDSLTIEETFFVMENIKDKKILSHLGLGHQKFASEIYGLSFANDLLGGILGDAGADNSSCTFSYYMEALKGENPFFLYTLDFDQDDLNTVRGCMLINDGMTADHNMFGGGEYFHPRFGLVSDSEKSQEAMMKDMNVMSAQSDNYLLNETRAGSICALFLIKKMQENIDILDAQGVDEKDLKNQSDHQRDMLQKIYEQYKLHLINKGSIRESTIVDLIEKMKEIGSLPSTSCE